MSKARSLVLLGATGFVGRHLAPRLAADGHRLTLLSRNREHHRELDVLPNVRVVSADVHDRAVLAEHFGDADAVLNLVGILNAHGQQTFRHVHVQLTETVIAACRACGVERLHQMSSLKAGQGTSDYLHTRGEAEAAVKASGLDWTIYQPSVIFGSGDGLVSRFHALLRMAPLLPLARPNARMAPVYVENVAEAIARCVGADATCSARTFELYGPDTFTLRQIVCMIRDAAGLHRPVIGLPDILGRMQAMVVGLLPNPPLSLDNFKSLLVDSVGEQDGLAALGIAPQRFAELLPALLAGPDHQRHLDRLRRNAP
jgi:uncharacterized protein YbjT (DUF2867 family)